MANVYTRNLGAPVPQNEQEDPRQVPNSGGGYGFVIGSKERLERFLILGTEKGTYYSDEKKLTKESFDFLRNLILADETLVIKVVRDVSVSGRAYRNSAAILAVAALFAYGKQKPRELVREVCRTSTHLFEFAEYVEMLGGWGPSKRKAVAEWYSNKTPDDLAYQVVKYRQRNGWTHRDLLRLTHMNGTTLTGGKFPLGIGEFITGKSGKFSEVRNELHPLIDGFNVMQEMIAGTANDVISVLNRWPNLPWEAIPTQFLKDADVWKKLFYNGQLKGQALLRNITRLSRLGAFNDMIFTSDVAAMLVDDGMIRKSRLHPFHYLLALTIHQEGQVDRKSSSMWSVSRKKDWTTNPRIVTALNEGFYRAFKYVEPANKRTLIGLDVSSSMNSAVCGIDISAAQAAAAMAMTIAKTELYYAVMGFADTLRDLSISPSMDLNDILRKTSNMNFGSTNCALPMEYALKNKVEVDTFVVITDNETNTGRIHPHVALKNYRQAMGRDAKLVVVACTPTEFSIADPSDMGMLDISGADTNLPSLIANFSAGRI